MKLYVGPELHGGHVLERHETPGAPVVKLVDMKLYVEPMDSVVVEVNADGQVKYEHESTWSTPSLQERRAIIYAAQKEIDALTELLETLTTV